MEKELNEYLEKIEKYLKPMAASERIDIVKEIKGEMLELCNEGKSEEEIVERLGSPRELAKAYLGEAISKNTSFSWRKFGAVIAFYSVVGISGMFILPIISILAIAFMLCGCVIPVCGAIKFVGEALGFEIPQISVTISDYSASAIEVLLLSFVVGPAIFFLGKLLWNLTIKLVKTISKSKEQLNV